MYDAVLRVGLPGLSSLPSSTLLEERYVSRVKMIPAAADGDDASGTPTWTVEAKSIQSQLFDSLKSRWQLVLVENDVCSNNTQGNSSDNDQLGTINNASCNVKFEVEIQVSNPLISFTLGKALKNVADKQVEAFERRCNVVKFLTHQY